MANAAAKTSSDSELGRVRNRSLNFLFYAFFFSIFVNLLMLTGPLFMLQVYDRVLGSRSEETLVALLVLVLALYGLMWLLDFARARLVARFGARFQSELDGRVFRATLTSRSPSPEAMTATRDLESVQGFFASPALIAILDAPFTPLFIAAIFVFHAWLGWLALAGGGILVALTIANQLLTYRKVGEAQSAAEGAHRFAENAWKTSLQLRANKLNGRNGCWRKLATSCPLRTNRH